MAVDVDVELDRWKDIKKMLDEEMLPSELQSVIFRVRDKLGHDSPLKQVAITKPSELLTYLENNMSHGEALTVIKHVLGSMQYHEEIGNRSFVKIIEEYESELDKVNIYHDDEFIGRQADIKKLYEILSTSHQHGVWIHGFGGFGKTTLANKLCSMLRWHVDVDVIHVDLKQSTTVCDLLLSILAHFNDVSTDSSFETLMQKTLFYLRQINKDLCVFLDNIEGIYDIQENKGHINNFIRGVLNETFQRSIGLVITSRTCPDTIEGKLFVHQIQTLAIEHADILLTRLCRPVRIPESDRPYILEICGNIPFAIRVVSRSIQLHLQVSESHSHCLLEQLQNEVCYKMESFIIYAINNLEESSRIILKTLTVFKTTVFNMEEAHKVLDIPKQDTYIFLMQFIHRQVLQKINSNMELTEIPAHNSYNANVFGFKYSFHPLILKHLENNIDQTQINKEATVRFCKLLLLRYNDFPNIDENFQEVVSRIQKENIMAKTLFETLVINETDVESLDISLKDNQFLSKITQHVFTNQLMKKEIVAKLAENFRIRNMNNFYLFWKIELVKIILESNDVNSAVAELNIIEHFDTGLINQMTPLVKADYLIVKGMCLRRQGNYSDALISLYKSLNVLNTSSNQHMAMSSFAAAYNTLGNVYFDMNEFDKSLENHKLAEEKLKSLVKYGDNHVLSQYTFNVGTIAEAKGDQVSSYDAHAAETMFKYALEKYNDSLKCDINLHLRYLPTYAQKLKIRSKVLVRLNRFEQAYADAVESLQIIEKSYSSDEENPKVAGAHHQVGLVMLVWLLHDIKTHAVSTSENRRRMKEIAIWFRKTENEIRNRKVSPDDKDAKQFLLDYKIVAYNYGIKSYQNAVKEFEVDFQTNFASSSSDSTDSTSEETDTSISSEDGTTRDRRKDSGVEECESNENDLVTHSIDENTHVYFPSDTQNASSRHVEVFMENNDDDIDTYVSVKDEPKRKWSSDTE